MKIKLQIIGLVRKQFPMSFVLMQRFVKKSTTMFGSKNHITEYGRHVVYHLMVGVSFNLPYLIYLNLLSLLKR